MDVSIRLCVHIGLCRSLGLPAPPSTDQHTDIQTYLCEAWLGTDAGCLECAVLSGVRTRISGWACTTAEGGLWNGSAPRAHVSIGTVGGSVDGLSEEEGRVLPHRHQSATRRQSVCCLHFAPQT
jgi:hypothetical protein